LAIGNARSNNIDLHIMNENLAELSAEMKTQTFDHVMTNPPFFEQGSLSAPVDIGKSIAHVETLNLQDWIRLCLKRLKPSGTFTIIQRVDRLPDILSALSIGTGNIAILPIVSRTGQDAKRVVVQSTKTSKAPLKLLSPFVVHSGVKHTETAKDFSQRASEILRDGTALNL
jgi:tRNA1Val (adenine37-N6)-methyltransferase